MIAHCSLGGVARRIAEFGPDLLTQCTPNANLGTGAIRFSLSQSVPGLMESGVTSANSWPSAFRSVLLSPSPPLPTEES